MAAAREIAMKRIAPILSALVVVALTACAGSNNQESGTPTNGGTVVIGVGNDAALLNPDLTTNSPDGMVGCLMYQGLVAARMDGNVDPLLAKSWTESPDGTTFTFHLVNAQWQDGQPFTSADVKYTLEQVSAKYSAVFARVAANIASINTPDPQTVVIQLTHPYGPFLFALSCNSGAAILPAHLFSGTDPSKNAASQTKPVGTGPFQLSEWVAGDHITLTKNQHYWVAGQPHISKLVVQIIPSAPSRLLALSAGQVQYLPYDNVDFNDYGTIRSSSTMYLHDELFPAPDDILFFNIRSGPTSNVQVRQALAMAIDRDYLLKAVWSGIGSVGVSSFDTRIAWAYDPATDYRKLYPFDVAKSKSALDAAGYKPGADGTRFTLDYVVSTTQQPYVDAGQALTSMFAAVGVKLKVEALDNISMTQRVFKEGKFDLSMQGYTTYGDPALGIVRQFVSSTINTAFGNASGYSNPKVDQLCVEGQNAATQQDRAKFYRQVQEVIAADLPSLIVHQRVAYDAASRRVQGAWGNEIGYGNWATAWIRPA
jgi:peptide/nickel transport system substrate-binding protein